MNTNIHGPWFDLFWFDLVIVYLCGFSPVSILFSSRFFSTPKNIQPSGMTRLKSVAEM